MIEFFLCRPLRWLARRIPARGAGVAANTMTVQELYDRTLREGFSPRKVQIFVAENFPRDDRRTEGDAVADVAFEEHPEGQRGWRGAYLVPEGVIHL